MKMLSFTAIFAAFSHFSFAQSPIIVVEKTIKVAAMATSTEYYGFAEGDKVIFNFSVEKGKELKDVTISEFPNSVKYAEHSIEKIENKIFEISRKGIYKFDYFNSYILARTISIKIQRIPKDETTRTFNTNIKWVDREDTTYLDQQESFILVADTAFEKVADSTINVSTQTSQGKTVVDFILPANTIKWTYWIGVGDKSLQAFDNDQKKFNEGASKSTKISPLAGLALGLFTMTHLTGGENIHYYFISTSEEAQSFSKGVAFKFFKQGNIVTDFGLMNYVNKNPQKYYLALRNESIQPINVNVKILSVVVTTKYKPIVEKAPILITHRVPTYEESH